MTYLAIDVGGTAVKYGTFTPQGDLLSFAEKPTDTAHGPDALVDALCEIVRAHPDCSRIGLSCTGQIDAAGETMVFATAALPGFIGYPLRSAFTTRAGKPVALGNDVNCAALGEARFGAGRDAQSFLCLTYGTGIGGAVYAGGIYLGSRGIAGEFGHMVTHAGGLPCVCGGQGCYEMYGSTRALVRRVAEAVGETLNGRQIFERFDEAPIRREVDGWIDEIVTGLISLTHAFNPERLILGGGILNEGYVFQQIEARLRQRLIESFRDVDVRRAELGNRAGVYGAYCLAAEMR